MSESIQFRFPFEQIKNLRSWQWKWHTQDFIASCWHNVACYLWDGYLLSVKEKYIILNVLWGPAHCGLYLPLVSSSPLPISHFMNSVTWITLQFSLIQLYWCYLLCLKDPTLPYFRLINSNCGSYSRRLWGPTVQFTPPTSMYAKIS